MRHCFRVNFVLTYQYICREDNPVVDYELLAAMAQLAPGEDHILHPSKSGIGIGFQKPL